MSRRGSACESSSAPEQSPFIRGGVVLQGAGWDLLDILYLWVWEGK